MAQLRSSLILAILLAAGSDAVRICSYAVASRDITNEGTTETLRTNTDCSGLQNYQNVKWTVHSFSTHNDVNMYLSVQAPGQSSYKDFEIWGQTSSFTSHGGNPVEFRLWEGLRNANSVQVTATCADDYGWCLLGWCKCSFAVDWSIDGDLPSPPSPPPSPAPPQVCSVYRTSGYWAPLKTCYTSECTWTTQTGTTHSSGSETSSSWETSVSNSISTGVGVSIGTGDGVPFVSVSGSANMETSFSGSFARSLSSVASQNFEATSSSSDAIKFTGVLWQFQYNVEDSCGGATIRSMNVAETSNANEPPCCLPLFILDPQKPHGACTDVDACLVQTVRCTQDLCTPTASASTTASSTTTTASSSRTPSTSSNESDNTGLIIGVAAAGVIAIIAAIVIATICMKTTKRAVGVYRADQPAFGVQVQQGLPESNPGDQVRHQHEQEHK